jgi:glycerol-3-phosphate dehydrogenase (NAD(P)+)
VRKIKFKVAVIGVGSWPTTIAKILAENGHDVVMLAHREAIRDDINNNHQQSKVLPDVHLPNNLTASCDPQEVLLTADYVVNGLASKFLSNLESFKELLDGKAILSLTKGMVVKNGAQRPSEFIKKCLPKSPLVVLSGPNLAGEIASLLPSGTVLASESKKEMLAFQEILSNATFRVYTSEDVVGVELGGILKNIMGIASGCVDGLKLGFNAKAMLVTRGLVEMSRFAEHLGASKDTLVGLSGLGDLIATCHSPNSRNYRVGKALGEGRNIDEVTSQSVAEGVNTSTLIVNQAAEMGIEMPITQMVHKVIHESLDPREAIQALMARGLKAE